MQLSSKIEGKICTVSITGSLSPDSVEKCETYLAPLIEDESIQVLLINCRKTNAICSAAWGLLIDCNKRLLERQARFALCEHNQVVQTGLKLMSLENTLQHFMTEKEALQAFTSDV